MKLLWILKDASYPALKGTHTFSFNVLRQLNESMDIHLAVFGDAESRGAVRNYKNHYAAVSFLTPPNTGSWAKWTVRALARFAPFPTDVIRYATSRTLREIISLVEHIRPDVVLLAEPALAKFLPLLSAGVPTAICPIDSRSRVLKAWARESKSTRVRLLAFEQFFKVSWFEAKYYQYACACVFVSEEDRLFVSKLNPQVPTRVVPLGVDTERYSPREEEQIKWDAVFHGYLGQTANRDAAISLIREVFPALNRRLPQARFAIIGAGGDERIRDEAYGSRTIEVLGFVEDIAACLNRARIYLCAVTYGSGMRIKVLEAMACGLPVVTFPANTAGISAKDGEEILIVKDAREMVEVGSKLLADPILRARIGRAARRFVENNFSWSRSAALMQKVLEECSGKTCCGKGRV